MKVALARVQELVLLQPDAANQRGAGHRWGGSVCCHITEQRIHVREDAFFHVCKCSSYWRQPASVSQRDAEVKERKWQASSNQEAHAENGADPATHTDVEHSGGGRSREGHRPTGTEKEATTHGTQSSSNKQGRHHRHQVESCTSCTRPRNKQDTSKGATCRHAPQVPSNTPAPESANPWQQGSARPAVA
jgi:hypothetical protein